MGLARNILPEATFLTFSRPGSAGQDNKDSEKFSLATSWEELQEKKETLQKTKEDLQDSMFHNRVYDEEVEELKQKNQELEGEVEELKQKNQETELELAKTKDLLVERENATKEQVTSGTTAKVPPPLSPAASEAAAGDIEIPEGVDPNFLAALPFNRLSLHSITDGRVSLERIVTDRLVHYFWVGHEQTNCFIF